MNDPNGLIFFEGEWHLFYQYLPPGTEAKHWGHAVSRDLLEWEHWPIALFPDELGAIWSGGCVADTQDSSGFFAGGSGLVAIFTHHLEGQSAPQSQSLAYSHDKGRTWTKYAGNPVLRSENRDFRDPKVFWHEPTESWVMILAAGDHAEIYRSADLKAWTLASRFGPPSGRGLVWECPDLFPIQNGHAEIWILSISLLDRDNFAGKVGTCDVLYFAGNFDGFTFAGSTHPRRLSHGPDDYASITFADAPGGRRVLIGWLNHWGYSWYSGQMTLPRELHWRDGGIVQTLASEADRASTWSRAEILSTLSFPASPWEVVVPANPKAWRLEARQNRALIFSLSRDPGEGNWYFIRGPASFPDDWADKKNSLESIFTFPTEVPFDNEPAETRIIVNACSVEAFCDAGRIYFSAQIFPPGGEWQIELLPA